ncbi:MAG: leucine-rich repeat protein [Ruminococcus sp.]|nr:leucine-rich repeat protein [Ruminococcus sp.]
MAALHCKFRIKPWIFGILSALVMLFLIQPKVCASESSEEFLYNENIYYQINERDEIVITRSRASVTEACIPAAIDGMPVTEIQNNAFTGRTRLTKVVLPDTVTKIGDYAFFQCSRLDEVVIPETTQKIGWGILAETPWLVNQPEGCILAGNRIVIGYNGSSTSVSIPEGATAIAGRAFAECESMMSVSIPGSVREIGGLAFTGCSQLTECTIPEGVVSIGEYAFNWCVALQKVEIADSVASIGNHAFVGCSSLISVVLPKGLTRIENAVFCGCTNLKKITIPSTVTDIGSDAFYGCVSLNEITLRSTVLSMGDGAFGACTGLQRLTIFNNTCKISDTEETIAENTAICGLRESTAQIYARNYGRQFELASPLPGDMDENGKAELCDASSILMLYAQEAAGVISSPGAYQALAGDVNGDGVLDIADASLLLKKYAESAAGK